MSWFHISYTGAKNHNNFGLIKSVATGKWFTDKIYDHLIRRIGFWDRFRDNLGWLYGCAAKGIITDEGNQQKRHFSKKVTVHFLNKAPEIGGVVREKYVPDAVATVASRTGAAVSYVWESVRSGVSWVSSTRPATAVGGALGSAQSRAVQSLDEKKEAMKKSLKERVANYTEDPKFADEIVDKVLGYSSTVGKNVAYYAVLGNVGLLYGFTFDYFLQRADLKKDLVHLGPEGARDRIQNFVNNAFSGDQDAFRNELINTLQPAFDKALEIAVVKGTEAAARGVLDAVAKYALHCTLPLIVRSVQHYREDDNDYSAINLIPEYLTLTNILMIHVSTGVYQYIKARRIVTMEQSDRIVVKELIIRLAKEPVALKLKGMKIPFVDSETIAEKFLDAVIDIAWPLVTDFKVLGLPVVR